MFGAVGCGQLLGLDEDRSRIDDEADDSADICACDDGNPCTEDTCADAGCLHTVVQSGVAPEQADGDCQQILCDAGVPSSVVVQDDAPGAEACLTWTCSGDRPISTPVTRGAACRDGGNFCDGAGTCVECIDDLHCGGGVDTCGGAGTPGFCGCAPLSCDDAGLTCGAILDGCGGTLICDNDVADGFESDVDCGGSSAACGQRCADGLACLDANDCQSGFCGGGRCATAWASTLSSASTATANAVISTLSGAVAVVGDFTESALFAGAPLVTESRAGFLVVIDSLGALTFGTELRDGTSARDVAVDSAGNILVVGTMAGATGNVAPHIEKRDSVGKPLWTVAAAGAGVATAVAVDSSGHAFIIGELNGAVTFGGANDSLTLTGSNDLFLVEIDTAGTVIGGLTFASLGPQKAVDVAVAAQGHIAVVGDFAGSVAIGDAIYDSQGDWDGYVTILDAERVAKSSRIIGGSGAQQLAGVAFDGAGRLYAAGTFNSELQISSKLLLSAGDSDAFVARFDEVTLEPLWVNTYGDAQHQHVAAVAPDVRGGVAIAGGFAGTMNFDGSLLASAGGMDAFFATIDENGSSKRFRRFGDHEPQHAAGIAMNTFGSVYVTGAFRGTVDFGQGPVTSVGSEDAFVAAF